jgi:hypothetical protein
VPQKEEAELHGRKFKNLLATIDEGGILNA